MFTGWSEIPPASEAMSAAAEIPAQTTVTFVSFDSQFLSSCFMAMPPFVSARLAKNASLP